MSGTVSKHNYLRAIGVAKQLQQKLEKSEVILDLDQALLALSDFYETFHNGILHIYWSHICEFLNNILWGIHTYLEPEYRRSINRVELEKSNLLHIVMKFWKA